MTRTKAEKIRKGIDNKIRKATVDMEWWADFWGFTVDEYEEFLDMAIKALEQEQERQKDIYECPNCLGEVHTNYIYCPFCGARMESDDE